MIKNLFENQLPNNEQELFKILSGIKNRRELILFLRDLDARDKLHSQEYPTNFFQFKWKGKGYVIDATELQKESTLTFYAVDKAKSSLFGRHKFYESQQEPLDEVNAYKVFTNSNKKTVKNSTVRVDNDDIKDTMMEAFEEIKRNGGKVTKLRGNKYSAVYQVIYGTNEAIVDFNDYINSGFVKISTKYKEEFITRAVKATSKAIFKTSLLVAFSPFFFLGKIINALRSRRNNP